MKNFIVNIISPFCPHYWHYFGIPGSFHRQVMGVENHIRICKVCYAKHHLARTMWIGKYDKQDRVENKKQLKLVLNGF